MPVPLQPRVYGLIRNVRVFSPALTRVVTVAVFRLVTGMP